MEVCIYLAVLLLGATQASHLPETYVSDSDIVRLTEQLWSIDENRFSDRDARVDPSGSRFITYVNEAKLQQPTFATLTPLLNMYTPSVGVEEPNTSENRRTERTFLETILQTRVMQRLWEFLADRGLASTSEQGFRDQLYNYWFTKYSRSRGLAVDSSGFEHVFAGELKNNAVSGFHNWVQFYLQEKKGALEYSSYIQGCEPKLHVTRFYWQNQYKRIGSLFVGTSPEYEMAIYTLCFLARPNGKCYISMDGSDRTITTYTMNNVSPRTVGTAYPDC